MKKTIIYSLLVLLLAGCEKDEVGQNGLNSLIRTSEEPKGTNCENGGLNIETGLDKNDNGLLDDEEVETTKYICNGLDASDGGFREIVRFNLAHTNNGPTDTTIHDHNQNGIVNFNIDNYSRVDSAIFIVYDIVTATGCCGAPDATAEVRIELFDLTNQVAISQSEIVSDDLPEGTSAISKNISNSFPHQVIDIGIRMIIDDSYYARTGKMYLILYSK